MFLAHLMFLTIVIKQVPWVAPWPLWPLHPKRVNTKESNKGSFLISPGRRLQKCQIWDSVSTVKEGGGVNKNITSFQTKYKTMIYIKTKKGKGSLLSCWHFLLPNTNHEVKKCKPKVRILPMIVTNLIQTATSASEENDHWDQNWLSTSISNFINTHGGKDGDKEFSDYFRLCQKPQNF